MEGYGISQRVCAASTTLVRLVLYGFPFLLHVRCLRIERERTL